MRAHRQQYFYFDWIYQGDTPVHIGKGKISVKGVSQSTAKIAQHDEDELVHHSTMIANFYLVVSLYHLVD